MASLNSPTTKIKLQLGVSNSHKLWASVFVGVFLLSAVVAEKVFWHQNSPNWKIQTETQIGKLANPLQIDWVIFDSSLLYFNTEAGQTIAADQTTGKIQWLREVDAPSAFSPFLIDDTTVAVVTANSEVFAFDKKTGKTKWVYEPQQYRQPDTILLVDDVAVYFADRGGWLNALDKKTGQLKWQIQFQTIPIKAFQSETTPLIHFGLMSQSEQFLFINHSPEKSLITIDKTSGQRIESTPQPIFYYQTPSIDQNGKPFVKISANTTPKTQRYAVAHKQFFLCQNQTALCSSEAPKLRIISVSQFSEFQKKVLQFQKWLPKFSKPLSITAAAKDTVVNQPFDLDFELNTESLNNLWEDVSAEVEFYQQEKKLVFQAYPVTRDHWRITAKLPTAGEWQWLLKVKTPLQNYIARGVVTTSPASQPSSYAWTGLGFQDSLQDLNSNNDYLDQIFIGESITPPATLDQAKTVSFEEYLAIYASNQMGFTAFRWSVDNFNFKLWQDISAKNYKLNLKAGQDGDRLVRSVAAHNLALDLDLFGFKPPFADKPVLTKTEEAQLKKYLKYMVGRYGAYVTSWEVGNEVSPSDVWITTVVKLLKELDPYDLPISINWERDAKLGLDFTSLHHYSSPSSATTQDDFLSFRANNPFFPVFTELGNRNLSWDTDSADRFKIRVWTAFMTQTPVFFWAQNGPLLHNPLNNSNIYLGPIEQQILQSFRAQTVGTSPQWQPLPISSQNEKISLLALRNDQTIWIYAVNSEWGTSLKTNFDLPEILYQSITWFDPSTGAAINTNTAKNSTPLFSHDLVGKIDLSK